MATFNLSSNDDGTGTLLSGSGIGKPVVRGGSSSHPSEGVPDAGDVTNGLFRGHSHRQSDKFDQDLDTVITSDDDVSFDISMFKSQSGLSLSRRQSMGSTADIEPDLPGTIGHDVSDAPVSPLRSPLS